MIIRKLGYLVALLALAGASCQREPAAPASVAPAAAPSAQPPTVSVATQAGMPPDATPPYAPATIETIERYTVEAQALSAKLRPGVDVAAAAQAAELLLALGAEIVPAYVERHPHCGAYLAAVLQVKEAWRSMDAATLERDFHKDAALPEVEGDVKVCYHMKDLVVHPATALALLSQSPPAIDAAQKEITEVIAHSLIVRQG
ncbi:MAG: hypothetical protein M3Q42_09535 [Pseudomonadota bacterium]|nr:hypothetical protein [Pseudomonadota bacterium]